MSFPLHRHVELEEINARPRVRLKKQSLHGMQIRSRDVVPWECPATGSSADRQIASPSDRIAGSSPRCRSGRRLQCPPSRTAGRSQGRMSSSSLSCAGFRQQLPARRFPQGRTDRENSARALGSPLIISDLIRRAFSISSPVDARVLKFPSRTLTELIGGFPWTWHLFPDATLSG